MSDPWETMRSAVGNGLLLLRAAGGTVRAHWALSFFSVTVAFVIWFIVQDVENPRVEQIVPIEGSQAIPVQVVNQSDSVIVLDAGTVHVRVDARKEEIPNLRAGDFRATVDAQGLVAGQTAERAVTVEAVDDDSVRILEVVPSTVQLRAVAARSAEFLVTANLVGELPAGFELDSAQFTPDIVTVIGTAEQIESVAKVEADIPLAGLRSTTTTDVTLVARTASGNDVDVAISEPRAQVIVAIQPTLAQREVRLDLTVTGQPALGYRLAGQVIEPSFATIQGPPNIISGIDFLSVGQIDVSGAAADLTEPRNVEIPPNVTSDIATATVRVLVAPITCGAGSTAPCTGQTLVVPVAFEDVPSGLAVAAGSYSASIVLAGPLPQLVALTVQDLRAIVSLQGAAAGTASYPAEVTLPAGIQLVGTPAVEVTLEGVQ